jgi:hypothetical protein
MFAVQGQLKLGLVYTGIAVAARAVAAGEQRVSRTGGGPFDATADLR